MSNSRRPRVVAAIVIGSTATLTFGTGVAYAALKSPSHHTSTDATAQAGTVASPTPSPSTSTPLSPSPTASSPAASTAPGVAPATTATTAATTTSTKPAAAQVVTYVVKPGDNLSVIAAWFKLHGYTGLYEANLKVIGANPNLIHPGERLVLGDGPIVWRTAAK